ncbi:MAG: hypothetical protein LBE12_18510 [Planctomycetaceae bacterium]|nr:hypothetical protein [Planctomycetaceae bacterium]
MSQADYYPNGHHSACDTIHSQLSTINYQLSTIHSQLSTLNNLAPCGALLCWAF